MDNKIIPTIAKNTKAYHNIRNFTNGTYTFETLVESIIETGERNITYMGNVECDGLPEGVTSGVLRVYLLDEGYAKFTLNNDSDEWVCYYADGELTGWSKGGGSGAVLVDFVEEYGGSWTANRSWSEVSQLINDGTPIVFTCQEYNSANGSGTDDWNDLEYSSNYSFEGESVILVNFPQHNLQFAFRYGDEYYISESPVPYSDDLCVTIKDNGNGTYELYDEELDSETISNWMQGHSVTFRLRLRKSPSLITETTDANVGLGHVVYVTFPTLGLVFTINDSVVTAENIARQFAVNLTTGNNGTTIDKTYEDIMNAAKEKHSIICDWLVSSTKVIYQTSEVYFDYNNGIIYFTFPNYCKVVTLNAEDELEIKSGNMVVTLNQIENNPNYAESNHTYEEISEAIQTGKDVVFTLIYKYSNVSYEFAVSTAVVHKPNNNNMTIYFEKSNKSVLMSSTSNKINDYLPPLREFVLGENSGGTTCSVAPNTSYTIYNYVIENYRFVYVELIDTNNLIHLSSEIVVYNSGRVDVYFRDYNKKVTITNSQTATMSDLPSGGSSDLMTEVTYSQLVSLVESDGLVKGMQYKITDYKASINSNITNATITKAHNGFDIIVTADSTSVLNENARACLRNKDTYFQSCNLDAWEIKYCLTNNDTRFEWADKNGFGVIYYMKDEYGNEAPYDFKTIMFSRPLDEYYYYMSDGTPTSVFTFSIYKKGVLSDYTVIQASDKGKYCFGNVIKPYKKFTNKSNSNISSLNDSVFLLQDYSLCWNNIIESDNYNNTFAVGSTQIKDPLNVYDDNHNYTANNFIIGNTFGINFTNNLLYGGCSFNNFEGYINDNIMSGCYSFNDFSSYITGNLISPKTAAVPISFHRFEIGIDSYDIQFQDTLQNKSFRRVICAENKVYCVKEIENGRFTTQAFQAIGEPI